MSRLNSWLSIPLFCVLERGNGSLSSQFQGVWFPNLKCCVSEIRQAAVVPLTASGFGIWIWNLRGFLNDCGGEKLWESGLCGAIAVPNLAIFGRIHWLILLSSSNFQRGLLSDHHSGHLIDWKFCSNHAAIEFLKRVSLFRVVQISEYQQTHWLP